MTYMFSYFWLVDCLEIQEHTIERRVILLAAVKSFCWFPIALIAEVTATENDNVVGRRTKLITNT